MTHNMDWREWLAAARLALGPFALAIALTCIAGWSLGFNPLAASNYAQWDSGQYLDIAQRGYELRLITPEEDPNYLAPMLGGNTGWFPGYPLAIRLGMATGASALITGIILSWSCFYLALLVLQRLLSLLVPATDNRLMLYLAAVFPGSIYYQAVFPVSMLLLLLLLTLYLLLTGRHWQAGLTTAAAAYVYTTGFLLIPVLALWLLTQPGQPWRQSLRQTALACGIGTLGFLAVFIHLHLATGHWDAFFVVQAKYSHGMVVPFSALIEAISKLATPNPNTFAPSLQTLLVALLIVGLCLAILRLPRPRPRADLLILVTVLAFWLFPLVTGGSISLTRQESLLLPAVLLTRHLAHRWQLVALMVFATLNVVIITLFFYGKII